MFSKNPLCLGCFLALLMGVFAVVSGEKIQHMNISEACPKSLNLLGDPQLVTILTILFSVLAVR